ncbi:MAG TPA: VWA domain-containing protein [Pyrinomonadaceae bacterium]|jgi:VWFA-related protein
MKSSVASLVASFVLAISVTLLAVITPAQTTHRSKSKPSTRAAAAVSTGTIRICQGVALPAGYIIVGYMTTAACPHGAYLLKKETESQSLRTANKDQGTEAQRSVTNKEPDNQPRDSVAVNRRLQQPAETSKSVSRARRVGVAQPAGDIPYLRGVEPQPAPRPPTLAGITPTGTPLNASSDSVSAPTPEEVSEGDVVRIDTALVTVPVSVLDRDGRFVPYLKREDFSVFENGIEQSIAYFEPAEKPFTVALLLDTSPSTHFHLWEIKEAAIAFAKQLRPQDRVLIVSFNDQVLLLTEATNDLNVVNAVVLQYAQTGNSTRLYDAVDLVIKERLNQIKGRKAIVLFTDGVDTSSYLATHQSSLREIEELDALIYPIQYDTTDYLRAMQGAGSVTVVTTTSNWPFPTRSSSRVIYGGLPNNGPPLPGTTKADYERADQYLRDLATKTGGRLYQANDTSQLTQAFSMIAEELRRQYSIGYYPTTSATQSADTSATPSAGTSAVPGDERRHIRVRVRQPNLAVRARDSYVRSSSPGPTK